MNKKLLSVILAFLMIFSSVMPVVATDNMRPLDISQVKVDNLENNKDAEVEFSVKNITNKEKLAKLIIGLYKNSSNEMILYNYVSNIIGANETKNWGSCIPIPSEGEYTIKAFAWDEMEEPNTISNVVTVGKEEENAIVEQVKTAINRTAEYQFNTVAEPEIGTIAGEWTVFSLARSGYDIPESYYKQYYSKVVDKVKEEHNKESRRWKDKVTDVERVAITLSSIGRDPRDVDGINLLDYIWDKEGNFPDIKPDGILGSRQGANELIFGLIALDARDYESTEGATITRDKIIQKLLDEYEVASGGFGLSGNDTMDLDITAMAIQGLAPYYEEKTEVKTAIDKAIDVLSDVQGDDGKYTITFMGTESTPSESIAQVVVALTEMGIDPHTDSRFVKSGNSLITALLDFYDEQGGFKHTIDGEIDPMATDQGLYALVAYDRFINQKNSLYDMTDIELTKDIVGKVKLSIEKRTIGKGDVLSPEEFEFYEEESVWNLIERVSQERNIDIDYRHNEEYDSVYISGIEGDAEFDYGTDSGWMYTVNDVLPDVGISQYPLENNDVIRLRYCEKGFNQDLDTPIVNILKEHIEEAKKKSSTDYTEESFKVLSDAITSAEIIANDKQYESFEIEKELIVSQEIGKLMEAISILEPIAVEPNPGMPEVINEVPEDFENDLWIKSNFEELTVGDEYIIISRALPENPYRQIKDYSYRIIEGNSVTVDKSGEVPKIVAEELGTSIIAVSYDALNVNGKIIEGISPVNIAYIVIDVVDETDKGITIRTDIDQRQYDTIYFEEGNSVDYDFTVDTEGADNVRVTCDGEELTANGNSYTASLRNKANIIGIEATNEKGTKRQFYTIDARKIEINIENVDRPGEEIEIGEKVKVSFKGITLPVYKLATIYNPCWDTNHWNGPSWEKTNGTYVEYKNQQLGGTVKGSSETQYDLAKNNAIEFIAEEEGTYKFTAGRIYSQWWGDELGSDREKNGAGEPNLDADTHEDYFSTLPDFEVVVGESTAVAVSSVKIIEETASVEKTGTVQLNAEILPGNAREKGLTWTSDNEEVAIIDENGLVKGISEGTATITVTTVDGNFIDTCEVTITPELPATEEEKSVLQVLVDEVKSKIESDYTESSWSVLQEKLTAAEDILASETALLQQVNEAKESLQKAVDALKRFYLIEAEVSPEAIHPGDKVTINIAGIEEPDLKDIHEMQTVYSTDISGLETVESSDDIGTIGFNIPQGTPVGEYTLNGGSLYVEWGGDFWPMWNEWTGTNKQNFYKESFPEIKINVTEVPVTDMQLDKETVSLAVYEEKTLNVSFTPDDATDKTVIYSSSNEDIATVDNEGKVTGVAEGTTIITVTSNSNKDIIKKCTIEVIKE